MEKPRKRKSIEEITGILIKISNYIPEIREAEIFDSDKVSLADYDDWCYALCDATMNLETLKNAREDRKWLTEENRKLRMQNKDLQLRIADLEKQLCPGEFQGRCDDYRDFAVVNKWWKHKLAIDVSGKEIEFDDIDELKTYVDELYNQ